VFCNNRYEKKKKKKFFFYKYIPFFVLYSINIETKLQSMEKELEDKRLKLQKFENELYILRNVSQENGDVDILNSDFTDDKNNNGKGGVGNKRSIPKTSVVAASEAEKNKQTGSALLEKIGMKKADEILRKTGMSVCLCVCVCVCDVIIINNFF
jgi:hypothetical protein